MFIEALLWFMALLGTASGVQVVLLMRAESRACAASLSGGAGIARQVEGSQAVSIATVTHATHDLARTLSVRRSTPLL